MTVPHMPSPILVDPLVIAGRAHCSCFLAGRMPRKLDVASPSSPAGRIG